MVNKKRGFSHKKATTYLIWFVLIEIVLISMISIGFWRFLVSVKDDNIFEKNYLARDIALTATAINSAPGDVEYNYLLGRSSFNFEFKDNTVVVSSPASNYEARYRFMYDDKSFAKKLEYPQKITLKKEKDKFTAESS